MRPFLPFLPIVMVAPLVDSSVLGFYLQLRDQISWLLECHGEDAIRRHRLFIGLTPRRGS